MALLSQYISVMESEFLQFPSDDYDLISQVL